MLRGPRVMCDASRSDRGKKRGFAGIDPRAGFKDDAEFDFRHRGTLPSGSSWSSRSCYSVEGADLTRRRYWAGSFRRTARSYRRPRSPPTEIRGDELHREAQEGRAGRPISAAVLCLSSRAVPVGKWEPSQSREEAVHFLRPKESVSRGNSPSEVEKTRPKRAGSWKSSSGRSVNSRR